MRRPLLQHPPIQTACMHSRVDQAGPTVSRPAPHPARLFGAFFAWRGDLSALPCVPEASVAAAEATGALEVPMEARVDALGFALYVLCHGYEHRVCSPNQ